MLKPSPFRIELDPRHAAGWGVVAVTLALTACGAAAGGGEPGSLGGAGGSGGSGGVAGSGGAAAGAGSGGAAGADAASDLTVVPPDATLENDWRITVYYTAVESFHAGPTEQVVGCPDITCGVDGADLGTYSTDFVDTVAEEGTGRLTSGPNAGRYLNWSSTTGYWLDDAPRDAQGGALVPFVSAAASASIAFGTRFAVVDCGVDDQNSAATPAAACDPLRAGAWSVNDRFETASGAKHVDLYIGEEDQVGFTRSSKIISTVKATLAFH